MPRRENKDTPKVMSGWLYGNEASFPVGSSAWWEWLNVGLSFYVEMPTGGYTARRELRRGGHFWYAFKRSSGKLQKVYLGRSHELTVERLMQIASELERRVQRAMQE